MCRGVLLQLHQQHLLRIRQPALPHVVRIEPVCECVRAKGILCDMYNMYSNQHAILSFIKCPCARNLHRLKSLNRRPVDQLCVGTFVPNTSDQSWLGTWVFCLQDSNKRDKKGKTRDDKAHLVATDTVEKHVTWLARPMKKLVLPRNKLACGRSLKKGKAGRAGEMLTQFYLFIAMFVCRLDCNLCK